MSILSERLFALRKKAGITQEEASERSGIHYRSYRRYESGEREPSASTLGVLADLYGVSTDYLLGRNERS